MGGNPGVLCGAGDGGRWGMLGYWGRPGGSPDGKAASSTGGPVYAQMGLPGVGVKQKLGGRKTVLWRRSRVGEFAVGSELQRDKLRGSLDKVFVKEAISLHYNL
eukprot:CAMPEP_0117836834 /NCGR_PEP_ID=MMETSP0949-20121206/12351_1 /TAXON_ID=44440 /ORGANISM="Chattonella subsalsa, Strain CCMP2191" /LENGTH=103 /DNA_ID=CAMNT_0005679159 /DNA_START=1059 /DNA_END=1371 /DNA_ORIENTATION=+